MRECERTRFPIAVCLLCLLSHLLGCLKDKSFCCLCSLFLSLSLSLSFSPTVSVLRVSLRCTEMVFITVIHRGKMAQANVDQVASICPLLKQQWRRGGWAPRHRLVGERDSGAPGQQLLVSHVSLLTADQCSVTAGNFAYLPSSDRTSLKKLCSCWDSNLVLSSTRVSQFK